MKKKLVIVGSVSLQEKSSWWKDHWENAGFEVTNYPSLIPDETFLQEYPRVYKKFFKDLEEADTVFVMNEDKNGVEGYIGAESFAELCFAVTQNVIHGKKIEILLLKMPEEKVQSYKEIELWLKLGWIKLLS